MGEYTVKEHYVSRFLLEYFSNKSGKVRVINLEQRDKGAYSTFPRNIFYSSNLYETKNMDDTYFDRNAIEKQLCEFEGKMAIKIPEIIRWVEKGNVLSRNQQGDLATLVAMQLIRNPFVRDFFREANSYLSEPQEKELRSNAMYRMVIGSIESGAEYLKANDFTLSEESLNILKRENAFQMVYDFIMNECDVYIIKADKHSFCIGDNPVLISIYDNARYIFPIMPCYAIVCALTNETDEEYNVLRYVEEDVVTYINNKSMLSAKRFVVFREDDEQYMVNQSKCFDK